MLSTTCGLSISKGLPFVSFQGQYEVHIVRGNKLIIEDEKAKPEVQPPKCHPNNTWQEDGGIQIKRDIGVDGHNISIKQNYFTFPMEELSIDIS